ncbi:MAG: gas vesicle protein GvpG [Nitrospirae bacterium]|nr:gas vesicle protein GvpG [Nitrospirota bacterium]
MLLIDDLLFLPFKGLWGVFKKIHEIADMELSDEKIIQERLMAVRLRFELDEISEEEYDRQEGELLAHLNAVRDARENKEEDENG